MTRAIASAPFDGPEYRKMRGPSGRRLCRWCGVEVPKGRVSWCSDGCVREFVIRKGGPQMVAIVKQRDQGICCRCGLDTNALDAVLDAARERRGSHMVAVLRRQMGFRETGELFDVDHIVPVCDGGGACGLENLRTLCTPCHKAVTAEMHARRAAERRRQDQPEQLRITP